MIKKGVKINTGKRGRRREDKGGEVCERESEGRGGGREKGRELLQYTFSASAQLGDRHLAYSYHNFSIAATLMLLRASPGGCIFRHVLHPLPLSGRTASPLSGCVAADTNVRAAARRSMAHLTSNCMFHTGAHTGTHTQMQAKAHIQAQPCVCAHACACTFILQARILDACLSMPDPHHFSRLALAALELQTLSTQAAAGQPHHPPHHHHHHSSRAFHRNSTTNTDAAATRGVNSSVSVRAGGGAGPEEICGLQVWWLPLAERLQLHVGCLGLEDAMRLAQAAGALHSHASMPSRALLHCASPNLLQTCSDVSGLGGHAAAADPPPPPAVRCGRAWSIPTPRNLDGPLTCTTEQSPQPSPPLPSQQQHQQQLHALPVDAAGGTGPGTAAPGPGSVPGAVDRGARVQSGEEQPGCSGEAHTVARAASVLAALQLCAELHSCTLLGSMVRTLQPLQPLPQGQQQRQQQGSGYPTNPALAGNAQAAASAAAAQSGTALHAAAAAAAANEGAADRAPRPRAHVDVLPPPAAAAAASTAHAAAAPNAAGSARGVHWDAMAPPSHPSLQGAPDLQAWGLQLSADLTACLAQPQQHLARAAEPLLALTARLSCLLPQLQLPLPWTGAGTGAHQPHQPHFHRTSPLAQAQPQPQRLSYHLHHHHHHNQVQQLPADAAALPQPTHAQPAVFNLPNPHPPPLHSSQASSAGHSGPAPNASSTFPFDVPPKCLPSSLDLLHLLHQECLAATAQALDAACAHAVQPHAAPGWLPGTQAVIEVCVCVCMCVCPTQAARVCTGCEQTASEWLSSTQAVAKACMCVCMRVHLLALMFA